MVVTVAGLHGGLHPLVCARLSIVDLQIVAIRLFVIFYCFYTLTLILKVENDIGHVDAVI